MTMTRISIRHFPLAVALTITLLVGSLPGRATAAMEASAASPLEIITETALSYEAIDHIAASPRPLANAVTSADIDVDAIGHESAGENGDWVDGRRTGVFYFA